MMKKFDLKSLFAAAYSVISGDHIGTYRAYRSCLDDVQGRS
jgi:hypothetical protein